MRVVVAAMIALAAVAPPAAGAQDQATSSAAPAAARQAIDPSALGISMARISRQLRIDEQARRQGDSPLKLEYFVDVYGTAPALRFFTAPELMYGAVPGSAPTHRDMLYQLTPQAFRSPRVDFLGLAYAGASAGVRKVQDWRYERDLRAYQKLIESGRIVPAPQPPRR
ncbi:MAG: hypothetical protein AB7H93_08675 [Vicinamibacterales bacterium]